MNQEIAKSSSTVMASWEEKLEVVRAMLDPEKKLSLQEMDAFFYQAKRTALDPIARQIYFTKNGGKMNVCATIDGLRLVSERSGKYRGMEGPLWCAKDGIWKDVWLSKEFPAAAKVGIMHRDFEKPIWATALWESYCPMRDGKPGYMWQKMGPLMIGKCAEALARRLAFPQDLSGIYSSEEMEQAGVTAPAPLHEPKAAEPAVVIDEQRQASAGQEDQRPPAEQAVDLTAHPLLTGFANDLKAVKLRSEANECWETFQGAVRDNAKLTSPQKAELSSKGFELKKKRVQELAEGK